MKIINILSLILALSACDKSPPADVFQGYVEGYQLNLAPQSTGIVERLLVLEGDQVAAGAPLFTIDTARAQAKLDAARAAAAASAARLDDMQKGGRDEDVQVAVGALKQAEANLSLAQLTFERSKALAETGAISMAQLDRDEAALDALRAGVAEAQSRLNLVRLPARADLIDAAKRELDERNAAVAFAKAELEARTVLAPAAGRIEAVYRREGEATGPTQPVLALLPPNQKRVRFFVPQSRLPQISHGDQVGLTCDNCDSDLSGEIVFISNQAEFTPPVIFTEKERTKLVYMVEVLPRQPDKFLIGQPVSVVFQ